MLRTLASRWNKEKFSEISGIRVAGISGIRVAARCATEAFQSHLCSTYRGLWGAGGCPVVVAQWQSTGCTSQVSWVRFPAAAGLFTFLYLRLITSKFLFMLSQSLVGRAVYPSSGSSWLYYTLLLHSQNYYQTVNTVSSSGVVTGYT